MHKINELIIVCIFRFTVALGGLAITEVIQKTTDRLEAIKVEGVHVCAILRYLMFSHLNVEVIRHSNQKWYHHLPRKGISQL